jgi:sterol desaturase/sphingolipid hydroxylase (fatty acid hydroxylase superfamily)
VFILPTITDQERREFEMNSRTALYCADIAVHPVLLVAAVVWTAPIDQSEMPMWLACFSIGVFAWTLAEYLMHRFAFHRLPIIYDLHKAHHDDPRAHLGSPFWIGVPLLAATLALLISVGGRSAGGEALAPVYLLAIFGIFAFTMRSIIHASRVLPISAEPNVPIRDIITRLSNAILA